MEKLVTTAAAAAVGMAVGAAVSCACTQSNREMRKTVHRVAKGAEKTMMHLDDFLQGMMG